MRTALTILLLITLAACSTKDRAIKPTQETVDDFVESNELEELDRARTGVSGDSFRVVNDYYVIYESQRGTYLFAFVRRCMELRDNTFISADQRSDSNWIRARFDTLRGCRIDRIYALTDEQAKELRYLGQGPGDRN